MTTLAAPEQYLLELINRARLDPASEVPRDGLTDLNQYIATTTAGYPITADPKQPLAGSNLLAGVAEVHSDAMNTSKVLESTTKNGHNDAGDGGSPADRIAHAGYIQNQVAGVTYRNENIGMSYTTAPGALTDSQIWGMTRSQHEGLFKDDPSFNWGEGGGHRLAMLDDNMREVGIGVTSGTYKGNNAIFVTEEFGSSGTQSFLTGVVYNDKDGDHFYGMNEAVQGVTATVTNAAGGAVGSDATGSGGGWSVGEPGGTYAVTFSGGGLAAAVSATVEGGNRNAKLDLVNGNEIDASASTTLGGGAKDLRLLGIGNVNGTGNTQDNLLVGNKGNNALDGGAGLDTAVYAGGKATYAITVNANGTITVAGAEGTDTLTSIEKIQFADQTYLVNPTTGSVSINDVTITEGNAGTKVATFTVTRTGGTAAFDVNYATADGTATRRQRLRRELRHAATSPPARPPRPSRSPSTATPRSSRTRPSSSLCRTRPTAPPSATARASAPSPTTMPRRWPARSRSTT